MKQNFHTKLRINLSYNNKTRCIHEWNKYMTSSQHQVKDRSLDNLSKFDVYKIYDVNPYPENYRLNDWAQNNIQLLVG